MVLPSYMWGDPAESLDRKRAEEKARQERRKKKLVYGLTEDELSLIPEEWLTSKQRRDLLK